MSAETYGLDNVFPHGDLSSGPETYATPCLMWNLKYMTGRTHRAICVTMLIKYAAHNQLLTLVELCKIPNIKYLMRFDADYTKMPNVHEVFVIPKHCSFVYNSNDSGISNYKQRHRFSNSLDSTTKKISKVLQY